MTEFKVVYHNADMDGHLGGAICRLALEKDGIKPQMIGADYPDDPTAWLKPLKPGDTVIMVDFSLQPINRMIDLADRVHLRWIDHHKTSMSDQYDKPMCDLLKGIKGVREMNWSGAELAWMHLGSSFRRSKEESLPLAGLLMPDIVSLVGRYDTWDHTDPKAWDQVILPTQYALRSQNTDPATEDGYIFWKELLTGPKFLVQQKLLDLRRVGLAVMNYQQKKNEAYVSSHAFYGPWEGYSCLICNGGEINGFKETSIYQPGKAQVLVSYENVRGEGWKVSLRADDPKVDVSALAKAYGGGGYKAAGGFFCQDLPGELVSP
jgi:hypothetical protein